MEVASEIYRIMADDSKSGWRVVRIRGGRPLSVTSVISEDEAMMFAAAAEMRWFLARWRRAAVSAANAPVPQWTEGFVREASELLARAEKDGAPPFRYVGQPPASRDNRSATDVMCLQFDEYIRSIEQVAALEFSHAQLISQCNEILRSMKQILKPFPNEQEFLPWLISRLSLAIAAAEQPRPPGRFHPIAR